MNLSKNFTLEEMTESDTATRLSIDNTPNLEQIANLRRLCASILQPLRDGIDTPIKISSGFRCKALNSVVSKAATSQHIQGLAADIKIDGFTPAQVAREVIVLGLPYDQMIHEGTWLHISVEAPGAVRRGAALTAQFQKGVAFYHKGIEGVCK